MIQSLLIWAVVQVFISGSQSKPHATTMEDKPAPPPYNRTADFTTQDSEEPVEDLVCPAPWFRIGSECFQLNWYQHSRWTKHNFTSARAYCASAAPDGDLAQPNDLKALNNYLEHQHYGDKEGVWYHLGGSDLATGGGWRWLNGSIINMGWQENQPNNYLGDQNCLAMEVYRRDQHRTKWGDNSLGDLDCEMTRFVCERQLNIGTCGATLTSSSGSLTTPNYPEAYGNDENCVWLISAPEDTRIVLSFMKFELENTYDFLYIRDGDDKNSTLLNKLTGDELCADVVSSGNHLHITFTSDSTVSKAGFYFSWRFDNPIPTLPTTTVPTFITTIITTEPTSEDIHEVSFSKSGGIARASEWLTDDQGYHTSGEGFPPSKGFKESSFWHSAHPTTVPQSLWFEFPEPIQVVKYSFRSRNTYGWLIRTDGPSKYIFWASNADDCSDETHWDTLNVDNSGTPFDRWNTPKSATIQNNYFYRCYGFKVLDVPGRDRATYWNKVGEKFITIGDVRFYSKDPTTTLPATTVPHPTTDTITIPITESTSEEPVTEPVTYECGRAGGSREARCTWEDVTDPPTTAAMTAYVITTEDPSDVTTEPEQDCPAPWFRVGSQCFGLDNHLMRTEGYHNFTAARAYCANQAPGGELAQPNDIKALAEYMEDNGMGGGYEGVWYYLGGSDLETEGDWRWLNGSIINRGWQSDQPNNYLGDQDCLAMEVYHMRSPANSLGDLDCDMLSWVCERPLS